MMNVSVNRCDGLDTEREADKGQHLTGGRASSSAPVCGGGRSRGSSSSSAAAGLIGQHGAQSSSPPPFANQWLSDFTADTLTLLNRVLHQKPEDVPSTFNTNDGAVSPDALQLIHSASSYGSLSQLIADGSDLASLQWLSGASSPKAECIGLELDDAVPRACPKQQQGTVSAKRARSTSDHDDAGLPQQQIRSVGGKRLPRRRAAMENTAMKTNEDTDLNCTRLHAYVYVAFCSRADKCNNISHLIKYIEDHHPEAKKTPKWKSAVRNIVRHSGFFKKTKPPMNQREKSGIVWTVDVMHEKSLRTWIHQKGCGNLIREADMFGHPKTFEDVDQETLLWAADVLLSISCGGSSTSEASEDSRSSGSTGQDLSSSSKTLFQSSADSSFDSGTSDKSDARMTDQKFPPSRVDQLGLGNTQCSGFRCSLSPQKAASNQTAYTLQPGSHYPPTSEPGATPVHAVRRSSRLSLKKTGGVAVLHDDIWERPSLIPKRRQRSNGFVPPLNIEQAAALMPSCSPVIVDARPVDSGCYEEPSPDRDRFRASRRTIRK